MSINKRYLVFAGAFYYPEGGYRDMVGMMSDLEPAKSYGESKAKSLDEYKTGGWWHVLDMVTLTIISEGEVNREKKDIT